MSGIAIRYESKIISVSKSKKRIGYISSLLSVCLFVGETVRYELCLLLILCVSSNCCFLLHFLVFVRWLFLGSAQLLFKNRKLFFSYSVYKR